MVLPVCFARLPDIGLKKWSHGVADEGVQRLVGRVFTECEHAQLRGHRLVRIDHRGAFDECQAGESEGGVSMRASFLIRLNICSLCVHTN